MLWVARPPPVQLLDCLVERTTVADLAHSITDGRYAEQKVSEQAGLTASEHFAINASRAAVECSLIHHATLAIRIL